MSAERPGTHIVYILLFSNIPFPHLLKPIVPDVLLELVILADHAKEQETEYHTEANEDNLAGVTVGSQISSFFKLYGRSICSTHMRI